MIYLHAMAVTGGIGAALAILLTMAGRWFADYGDCSVKINDEEPFVVKGGCKLLDALYGRRIFIPSACGGQGTCGFCKVRVLQGGGTVLPTELPYLNDEETAGNVRLACQVKVKEDMVVRVRPDFLKVVEFTGQVKATRMVTHDTRELLIDLVEPSDILFKPGQYVQVMVPDQAEPTYRAYSISSVPRNTGEIELLVRLIPGGLGSTYLHRVEVGDSVLLTGPYGDFELSRDADTEIVCVGGGCGMAPMRSIIRHLGELDPARKCRLFFGARTADDVMYRDEFDELARGMKHFDVHYAVSEPGHHTEWDGETGFIHESVARHLDEGVNCQAFLCGPPAMIEAVLGVLEEKGVGKDRIFYDEF